MSARLRSRSGPAAGPRRSVNLGAAVMLTGNHWHARHRRSGLAQRLQPGTRALVTELACKRMQGRWRAASFQWLKLPQAYICGRVMISACAASQACMRVLVRLLCICSDDALFQALCIKHRYRECLYIDDWHCNERPPERVLQGEHPV